MTNEPKITYVSIASSPEFHRQIEEALDRLDRRLGAHVAASIAGEPSASGERFEVCSPIDTRIVVATVDEALAEEAERAVEAAGEAFPAWRSRPSGERSELLRGAADLVRQRKFDLAATMMLEVGKNRIEALAEVEETADLLTYYADRMDAAGGYRYRMARVSPDEATESVYLPYGVWGVISPFNFPAALAAGMAGGALVTGNCVVLKPATAAPLSAAGLCAALWDAGVPRDVLHLVTGPGGSVGMALRDHPSLAGIAFTGSYEVGMEIYRGFSEPYPRPVVLEMGGKNPTIVTASADVGAAAGAVARSAFGFGGQKCSACSRAYVAEAVAEEFVEALVEVTRDLEIGDPRREEVYLGPLVDRRAVASFEHYVGGIEESGGEILYGGETLTDGDLAYGFYVEPTVATLPDATHPYFHEEMFVPLLLVEPVRDLEEGLELSNRAPYGLTAGLFTGEAAEVERFLSKIESGVTYVNRKSGSTTGAWPGVNPFGGWKASGGIGPAGLGPNYLLNFLREQSRAINDFEPPPDGGEEP